MGAETRFAGWLWLILLIGLLLRVGFALDQPTLVAYGNIGGGDSAGYLANGWGFYSGAEHGRIRDQAFYVSSIKPAPLYILYVGIFQQFFPDHEAIIAIRILQCLASAATVYLVHRIATVLSRDERAGLAAAAALAFHPAMVVEPANIATETLYIFFITLGLWLYTEYFVAAVGRQTAFTLKPKFALLLVALALGLATLTRAVSLLFPVVIALHLWLLGRRRLVPNWHRNCLAFLILYSAILSTWTIYNLVLWDRFVIVSDQGLPALWRGFEDDDGSPRQNDKLLLAGAEPDLPEGCVVDCKYQHPTALYLERIQAIIDEDIGRLIALRVSELGYSILQPHGTNDFGDVSIMAAARHWLENDRTVAGIAEITHIEGFAIKLAVWIFHYFGLVFGIIGVVWSRKSWILTMPLIGFVLYTIMMHTLLLSLPRYIFPLEVILMVFASISSVNFLKGLGRFTRRGRATE